VLIFNKIKPEDCVFGDSIGEGKLLHSQASSNQVLNYRCIRQREGGVAKGQAKQKVRYQDNEEARYHHFKAC
jgi:hypothetical protein